MNIYKCQIIDEKVSKVSLSIRKLCKIFDIGKSTYYDWIKQEKPKNRCIDSDLKARVEKSFIGSGSTYGWRRIKKGISCNFSHKKIRRLMIIFDWKPNNYRPPSKKAGVAEKEGKYERLIKTNKDINSYGDVFSVDITEKTIKGQKLYTAGFYHVKEKKIYGLVTLKNKGTDLIVKSFEKLVDEFGVFKPNSVVHSDNGTEFKSYIYKLMLMHFELKISMSRVAKSTDNGYIEGFWSTLKREAILENYSYKSIEEYLYNFNLYSKFYNNDRIKL